METIETIETLRNALECQARDMEILIRRHARLLALAGAAAKFLLHGQSQRCVLVQGTYMTRLEVAAKITSHADCVSHSFPIQTRNSDLESVAYIVRRFKPQPSEVRGL